MLRAKDNNNSVNNNNSDNNDDDGNNTFDDNIFCSVAASTIVRAWKVQRCIHSLKAHTQVVLMVFNE